jgi:hypothetical protein
MYNRSPPPIRNDVLPVAASRDRHARVCTTRRPYTAFIRSFDLDQLKKISGPVVHACSLRCKIHMKRRTDGRITNVQIEQQSSRMDQSSDESLLLSPEPRGESRDKDAPGVRGSSRQIGAIVIFFLEKPRTLATLQQTSTAGVLQKYTN